MGYAEHEYTNEELDSTERQAFMYKVKEGCMKSHDILS
jgi:hypothetical protein